MAKALTIDPAVIRRLRDLPKTEKVECLLASCELTEIFGQPHIHSGLAIRKLGDRLFECRGSLTSLGTASSFGSSLTSTAHVALILASVVLLLRAFIILVALSAIATFAAPAYSQTPILFPDEYFRTAGVLTSIGVILIGGLIFRTRNERDRLEEVNRVNAKLEALAGNLEARVNDRTAELDRLNQITTRRAAQLQTIADLAHSIAQVQSPNDLLPAVAQLISERFGFYHVGIFLLDANNEFAILVASNSDGGQKMLARNHKLKVGKIGIVGNVAGTGLQNRCGSLTVCIKISPDADWLVSPERRFYPFDACL